MSMLVGPVIQVHGFGSIELWKNGAFLINQQQGGRKCMASAARSCLMS